MALVYRCDADLAGVLVVMALVAFWQTQPGSLEQMVAFGPLALGDGAFYYRGHCQLYLVAYAAHYADLSSFVVEGHCWLKMPSTLASGAVPLTSA